MKALLCVGMILLFTTCSKVDLDTISNLNNNKIWVIGHAGEGFQTGRRPVPTNSETSITKAIEYYNADGCEIDVQMSKDSALILFHDDYLEQSTHCQGCVYELNESVLLSCRFKQDFAVNTLQNETLIGLERVFQKYCHTVFNPQFFLDLKLCVDCNQHSEEYYNGIAHSLVELIRKHNAQECVFITCGSRDLLYKIKNLNPNLKLIFNIGSGDFETGMAIALDNGFYGVEIYNDYITRSQSDKAHQNNLWVIIYGVKDRNTQINAVKKSPDAIITDNIPLLQEILTY